MEFQLRNYKGGCAARAEAFYLNDAKAYIIGILLHSYSTVTSFALWVLGIDTLKLKGVFFLSLNLIKAIYPYMRVRALIKSPITYQIRIYFCTSVFIYDLGFIHL